MAFLNWRASQLTKEIGTHASLGSQLKLTLTAGEVAELGTAMTQVLTSDRIGEELRVNLPDEWLLFLKPRAGGTRLLLAHPSATEWVVTAALAPDHARALVEKMGQLRSGQSLAVSELGSAGYPSNVELVIAVS